jgi:hypothetical protein
MRYPYENLGPERFQEFCQALLVRSFPDLQCLPVGQPDGGRDAFVRRSSGGELLVFQVKFARNPGRISNPVKWLSEAIESEAPKVNRLQRRGLTRYVLLTNLGGSAHLEAGSIDRIGRMLDEQIQVPTQCWWGEDLDRRLESNPDIRWSYLELVTAGDVLRELLRSSRSEEDRRRADAVRGFLQSQYVNDSEVRFRQVELQNQLLDLFVDVPTVMLAPAKSPKTQDRAAWLFASIVEEVGDSRPTRRRVLTHEEEFMVGWGVGAHRYGTVGAASLFLHHVAQSNLQNAVLEGAPGQGKSTLAQYVCQVHRMRLLSKRQDLRRIPADHKNAPIRIPIRADIRDFGTWLSGSNPFDQEGPGPEAFERSLEGFIARLIRHQSGGVSFSVADLHAVLSEHPVLIVLDGLDEVADIGSRVEIVNQVTLGLDRLRASPDASVQTIVTSRPAAFANSPGFPWDVFRYFHLESLTRSLITDYGTRWAAARSLDAKESGDIMRILKMKLDQPHMRDLARNPMQLTILLSLINARGPSLPDKRTALYKAYIDHFLDRESEKSATVREHRDLLIDLHRYLAWVLQTGAEGGDRGSIERERLIAILQRYLDAEGHNPNLADELFQGMVERVFVLVSRVQGTYEFEVQPLREYFCARHLYDTAPYSPPGGEVTGTLPDRFDGISRNFYWLNVTRFYAGCFSKGELPGLADSLAALSQDSTFQHTDHPRSLAATLLADWVFAQHPRATQRVTSLLMEGLGSRHVLNVTTSDGQLSEPVRLHDSCGGTTLRDRCMTLLERVPPRDRADSLCLLLRLHAPSQVLTEWWSGLVEEESGTTRTRLLRYGERLGVLDALSANDLLNSEPDEGELVDQVSIALEADKAELIHSSVDLSSIALKAVLDRRLSLVESPRRMSSPIRRLGMYLSILSSIPVIHWGPEHMSLRDVVGRTLPTWPSSSRAMADSSNAVVDECRSVLRIIEREASRPVRDWMTSLHPWNRVIEACRGTWGESWATSRLAIVAAGIPDKSMEESPDLVDIGQPLLARVRGARLRSGAFRWWKQMIERPESHADRLLVIGTFFSWASPRTIRQLRSLAEASLKSLTSKEFERVVDVVEASTNFRTRPSQARVRSEGLEGHTKLSPRLVTTLAARASLAGRMSLVERYLPSYKGTDPVVLELLQRTRYRKALSDSKEWPRALQAIRAAYRQGSFASHFELPHSAESLPVGIAQKVVEKPTEYPLALVAVAEARCKSSAMKQITPVGERAQQEEWFSENQSIQV